MQRMQRYVSQKAGQAGPEFAKRRASFAGNLLAEDPMDSSQPEGVDYEAARCVCVHGLGCGLRGCKVHACAWPRALTLGLQGGYAHVAV